MGIVKFSIWLNIPSKYRGFICHCFCYCGYIFRKINWHILSGFFRLFFGISLALVKADVKCLDEQSFFPEMACHFLFLICVIQTAWICFDFEIWQAKKQGEHNSSQTKPSFSDDQSFGESQNIIQIQKMKIRNAIKRSQPFQTVNFCQIQMYP